MKNKILLKTLSAMLVAVVVLCSAPLAGFTGIELPDLFSVKAEAYTEGVFSYSVSNGKATITDCNTSVSGDLVIPSTLGGYSVTSIGYEAFYNCSSLTSVTIPDSVISIGTYAFYGCNKLEDVYYTGDIESWCGITFGHEYSNPMLYVKNFYMNNTLVEEIVIPDTVTEIKDFAFLSFEGITSVTIPDSVTSIGDCAFAACTSLASIVIGDDVTSISGSAFYNTAYYSDSTNWENGVLYIENYLLKAETNLSGSYEIKNGTTVISDVAFENCESLTSVTIGDSVTSIGDSVFENCESLTSVTIGDSVTSIGDSAFAACTSLTSVTIPDSVTSIGDSAFAACTSLTLVTIGNSVESIGNYAFSDCISLTSITIPDSVTSIGECAFEDCISLADVYYTGDIESWCGIEFIDTGSTPMLYAKKFYINNTLVKEIVIPDTVTEIKDYAFFCFEGITSVTIGNSATSIGDYAFYGCTDLTSVTIVNSVTRIGICAFCYCTSLTSVIIGNSVTYIDHYAFSGCTSLEDVYYTGDIESWCGIEFGNCYANPMYYAKNFYINNTLVKEIVIPDTITVIKPYTFYSFEGITSVTIVNSVEIIGVYAFYNCTSLESATIPDSVEIIGDGAFGSCTNLTSVCFEGTESQWNEIEIYDGNECLINAEIRFLGDGHEHSYTSSVTTEPTCTEDGVKIFECGCGDSYTESIPATGHTWSKWMVAVEPTETDNGFKARFCTVCDDAIESEVIPATGSGDSEKTGITITLTDENGNVIIKEIVSDYNTDISFENGTYTLTISKENYVARTYTVTAADNMMSLDFSLNKIGDMNGDGKVNTVDVAKANAHAKGVSTLSGYDLACVDVNGDGKVNTVDVAKMNAHAKGVTTLW